MGTRPTLLSSVVALGIAGVGGGAVPAGLVATGAATAGVVAAALTAQAALMPSSALAADGDEDAASPTVVPGEAASTGLGTVQFTGQVVPGDAKVTYSFEYGLTDAYGIGTPGQTIDPGDQPVAAQATAAGLGIGQTWHYRLVARSSSGIAYGPDQTFTTPLLPLAPLVVPTVAEDVGADRATLRARVDPVGQPTTVVFEYGPTPALGASTAPVEVGADASLAELAVPVTGLTPSTLYYFRAVASNAAGTSVAATLPLVTSALVTKIDARSSSRTLVFGKSATISGALTGAGVVGAGVALMRQDFPFTGPPVQVGTVVAGEGGSYEFPTGALPATAKYWVQSRTTPRVSSGLVTVYGKLAVTLDDRGASASSVTLQGTVAPYVAGARATLQRRAGSGRWITVSQPKLTKDGSADRATFSARAARYASGTMKYRLLVDPRSAGAHYATASNVIGVKRK